MADEEFTIQYVVTFELGDLPDGGVALLLAYAPTAQDLARGEMKSVIVGLTREKATELGKALQVHASKPPKSDPTPRH